MRKLALALGVAAMTVVAACGSDDPETTEATTDDPDTTEATTDDPDTTEATTDDPETTDDTTDDTDTTEASACAAAGPTGEVHVGEALSWETWDPVLVTRPAYDLAWLGPVYETLFEVDQDLELTSSLLSSWELASDALHVVIEDGIMFHDGTPFDAEALKYNIERVRDTEGPNQAQFANVGDVEVLGPLEARLPLSAPAQSLPFVLAKEAGLMASPTAAEAGSLATEPVGTGPWVLNVDETQADAQAVYEAWPEYRDPSVQCVQRIVIYPGVFGPEPFGAGDLDISYLVGPQQEAMEGIGVVASEPYSGGRLLMFLDRGEGGVFEDPRVRAAVASAIDRATILEVTSQAGEPSAVWVAGTDYGDSSDLVGHPYDVDETARLLAEAGVDNLSFSVPVGQTNQAYLEAMQAVLRESGIEMSLVPVATSLNSECASGAYAACIFNDGSTHPAQLHEVFVSPDSIRSTSGVIDPAVAAAAEAALNAPDMESAEPLWNEYLKALFNDDVGLTYLVRDRNQMAYNPDRVSTPNLLFVAPTAIDFRGLEVFE